MDPKESGDRRPPHSFGSGRRPRPYICFKNRQITGSGVYFLYFLIPEAVSACIFFVFFRVPPESPILYISCVFYVFFRDPPKWLTLYILYFYGYFRNLQSVALSDTAMSGPRALSKQCRCFGQTAQVLWTSQAEIRISGNGAQAVVDGANSSRIEEHIICLHLP